MKFKNLYLNEILTNEKENIHKSNFHKNVLFSIFRYFLPLYHNFFAFEEVESPQSEYFPKQQKNKNLQFSDALFEAKLYREANRPHHCDIQIAAILEGDWGERESQVLEASKMNGKGKRGVARGEESMRYGIATVEITFYTSVIAHAISFLKARFVACFSDSVVDL